MAIGDRLDVHGSCESYQNSHFKEYIGRLHGYKTTPATELAGSYQRVTPKCKYKLQLSGYRLTKDIGVPVTRVHAIVHEERGISADSAKRLTRYFRTTPEFWLNLQNGYDLADDDAAQDEIDQIEPCPDIEVAVRRS